MTCNVEQQLLPGGVAIRSGAAGTVPTSTAGAPDFPPTCRTQTRARLGAKDISNESPISHCPRRSPAGGIELRCDVRCAIRAKPRDLRRPPVIEHPCNRSADDGDTDDTLAVTGGDAELAPLRWPVVPMVKGDELAGFPKRNRLKLDHLKTPSRQRISVIRCPSISDERNISLEGEGSMWGRDSSRLWEGTAPSSRLCNCIIASHLGNARNASRAHPHFLADLRAVIHGTVMPLTCRVLWYGPYTVHDEPMPAHGIWCPDPVPTVLTPTMLEDRHLA